MCAMGSEHCPVGQTSMCTSVVSQAVQWSRHCVYLSLGRPPPALWLFLDNRVSSVTPYQQHPVLVDGQYLIRESQESESKEAAP